MDYDEVGRLVEVLDETLVMVDVVESENPIVGGRDEDVVQEGGEGETVHWAEVLFEYEVHGVLEHFPKVRSGLEEVFGSDVALDLLGVTVLFERELDVEDVLGQEIQEQLEGVVGPLESLRGVVEDERALGLVLGIDDVLDEGAVPLSRFTPDTHQLVVLFVLLDVLWLCVAFLLKKSSY